MILVCTTNAACTSFPLLDGPDVDPGDQVNMTCYKGGETVFENHQMCDVTSESEHCSRYAPLNIFVVDRKILDQLDGRKPEVTFSCNKEDGTCQFQFWAAQVESFYCGLSRCTSELKHDYDYNTTLYSCEKMECRCVPGRFICGENGSVGKGDLSLYNLRSHRSLPPDIHEYFEEDIKGPATFSCKTGSQCTFEEPAMNELILTFFGDPYITLNCQSGECLHISQVPGYIVSIHIYVVPHSSDIPFQRPPKPDNSEFVAFTVAGAGLIVVLASASKILRHILLDISCSTFCT